MHPQIVLIQADWSDLYQDLCTMIMLGMCIKIYIPGQSIRILMKKNNVQNVFDMYKTSDKFAPTSMRD